MNDIGTPNAEREFFALQALQKLPQARHFTRQQAQTWWATMQEREAGGAGWSGLTLDQHIRRLGGFGASEIGLLVSERRGLYSPFGTVRELVMEKLLQRLPDPANAHTHRGLVMEPLIREAFLRHSGAVRRNDLTQRVATHTAARWPWMMATPDDLVEIHGRLGVVDYKAPAEPLTDLTLAHACQLHQIAWLARDLGIPIQFQAIVAWNHPRGTPEVFLCENDPQLEQEIIEVGDESWNQFVLTGECPDWPARETRALTLADLSNEAKTEIETLAERYLRLDILAKEAKTLTDAARARLLERCHAHHLAETVASGPVHIKPQAAWNVEAIEARLNPAERLPFARPPWDARTLAELVRELGGNPDAARSGDPAADPLDLEAAARWLMDTKGLPETVLRQTLYKSSISRAKAHDAVLESLRADAIGITHTFGVAPEAGLGVRPAAPAPPRSPSASGSSTRSSTPSRKASSPPLAP